MKKNDWLLIASAIMFSVLFYKQATGLNYLVFAILLTCLIGFFNPHNLKQTAWWYYAGLTILCSVSVFVSNTDLSIFATLFSVLVLSGKSYNVKTSIMVNVLLSTYSLLTSFVYLFLDLDKRKKQNELSPKANRSKIYLGVFIAVAISIMFFALYQQANPLFKNFTAKIDLSWISIGWCFFTLFGFLLIYGIVFYRDQKNISQKDLDANYTIVNTQDEVIKDKDTSGNTVIAITLFILLNVMLLFVNVLDLNSLISKTLPEGISLSDFVHQAVWSLVFSIVIAVGLIMWFFKSELNFHPQSKKIKSLVYAWMIQSAMMLMSAMVRNAWYIDSYQLSYLRVGVYVFLFLSMLGLFFTFLKLQKIKSSWYLVRQNFEGWLLMLVLCSLVNWDKLITSYNMTHTKNYDALDKDYLLGLSDASLPSLAALIIDHDNKGLDNWNVLSLSSKIYDLNLKLKDNNWQSFNIRDWKLNKEFQTLLSQRKITQLSLNLRPDLLLEDLSDFRDIRSLHLRNVPADIYRIAFFKQLEELSFDNFSAAHHLQSVSMNEELKRLKVHGRVNLHSHIHYLKMLKKLEELNLDYINNEDLLELNGHSSLKVLQLRTLYQDQIAFIRQHHLSFKVEEMPYETK